LPWLEDRRGGLDWQHRSGRDAGIDVDRSGADLLEDAVAFGRRRHLLDLHDQVSQPLEPYISPHSLGTHGSWFTLQAGRWDGSFNARAHVVAG
jgi:hypothetical protein